MKIDEVVGEALKQAAGQARFDPGRWESMADRPVRGGRTLGLPPMRRRAAAALVAAVALAAVAVPLVLLSPLGGDRTAPAASGRRVEGQGLSIEVPEGWDGRISSSGGEGFGPSLHVSNAPLPGEIDGDVYMPFEGLAVDETVVMLQEVVVGPLAPGSYPPLDGDPAIALEDVRRFGEGWANQVHSYIRDEFSISGRKFNFAVGFGGEPTGALIDETNGVLATLRVEPSAPPPGYVTHTDAGDGLAITIPQEWSFSEEPTDPIEPENVIAVGSWAFPEGGVCAPFAALDDLPSDGAFFWMIEYHGTDHPEDFVSRPDRFDLQNFRYGETSCEGTPMYQLRFRDAGRFFQLQVAFGGQAPEPLRAEVLRALDSIEVTAPVPDECPADTGPWSGPACPLPAWTRAVVEEAGYEVTGDTGSALVARAAGSGIYIWTTEEEELSTEPTFTETLEAEGYERWGEVAGRTLSTDGTRAVWVVQGLRVWVAGGPMDDLPELDVVAPLVEASERVDYDAIDTR